MSQAKVTSFFPTRKRNSSFHASKRLKVEHTSTDACTDLKESSREQSISPCQLITKPDIINANEATSTKPAAKSVSKSTPRSKRQVFSAKSQTEAKASFRVTRSSSRSSSPVSDASIVSEIEVKDENIKGPDIVTAACDDHTVSAPGSPSKHPSAKDTNIGSKRSKHVSAVRRDLLSAIQCQKDHTSGYDFSKFLPKEKVARKRLIMKRRNDEHLNEKRVESEDETKALSSSETVEEDQVKLEEPQEKAATVPVTSKPSASSSKRNTETLDPLTLRTHLGKSGKLVELQARLSQFNKTAVKVKKDKQVQSLAELKSEKEKANEAAKPNAAPAFERYRALADQVPPGLVLPYKYKVLLDVYHAVDTVVSMLHKRSELCTFSKLKKAVQVMTSRTFEEKNLAQIQSVFTEGFTVRQEKGLVIPGTGNLSGWQLTVEANLPDVMGCQRTKDGRPTFTAAKLLERKSLFHRLLIDIVKGHHKQFLAKMERPLVVPDDKVTRWHPRFRVDQVPEIIPAQLPQPPDTLKFSTAAQVLEAARTKNQALNARVQKALENVAKQKKAEELKAATKKSSATKAAPEHKANTELKGVPQGLLERIRAKEAEKTMRSMMQSPADEKRKEQISRLPDIVRIIRTYFVMYKKPCIPMDETIRKVSISTKSSMGTVEAEAHIKLLLELVPEWVSIVTVRKGTYLKIDRNQDLTKVISKLMAALKQ